MRSTWIVAAVAMFLFGDEQVYQGPWCAVVTIGSGTVTWDCHYRSFEECAPNVIAGNRGFCNRNPRWPGYYQGGAAGPKNRKSQ